MYTQNLIHLKGKKHKSIFHVCKHLQFSSISTAVACLTWLQTRPFKNERKTLTLVATSQDFFAILFVGRIWGTSFSFWRIVS